MSIGSIQNPELASILLTFLTLLMLDVTSWNVCELWTLNLRALLIVLGSRQTLNLPFGFHTRTKLWHQSVASLMSNLQVTASCSILFNSVFNGSIIACGTFLGGWTTSTASGLMSRFTIASLIIPIPSNKSGKTSIACEPSCHWFEAWCWHVTGGALSVWYLSGTEESSWEFIIYDVWTDLLIIFQLPCKMWVLVICPLWWCHIYVLATCVCIDQHIQLRPKYVTSQFSL